MIEALKFVKGAIKTNAITPELEHYQIKDGAITGFNGYMALSSPIALDIEARPKAQLFYKAIDNCGDKTAISLTESNRLSIRSGKFRAFIPCIEHDVYEARPQGEVYPCPPGLVKGLKAILPFISTDASRPWAMGVDFRNGCMTATNNVIIIQSWINHSLPVFNCPRFAVAELVRIGKDPYSIQMDEHSVTFWWDDGKWLKTQVLSQEWPDALVGELLDKPCSPEPIPDDLFSGLAMIKPFMPDNTTQVIFEGGKLVTGEYDAAGASVDVDGLPDGPTFSVLMLELLEGVATHIDFKMYPEPCAFRGDNLRGVIMGLRF